MPAVETEMGDTIRVLIADDEAVLRSALADLVASDDGFELVGAARDADEAIAMAEATKPDVALIDVRMPGGGGLRVAEELRERVPSARVIAHTAVDDRTTVVRMLRGGAVGYLVKGTPPAEIIGAIRGASRGQPTVSSDVMSALVKDLAAQLEREEISTSMQRERTQLITRAIEGEGRSMAFQPIVELEHETLVGLEALARFDREPGWPVSRWFAEAAEAGLGLALELACVRDALDRLTSLPANVYLSINTSHRTAGSPGLLGPLERVDASRVVVEITEHEQVEDYDVLTLALGHIRERGARIAIDDAGAGFASLRHLLLIDPEIIKLDVSLTRNIDTDVRKRALAAALTSFAEEMGKDVVAEGIETPAERETLRDLGVRFGQGFFLGRPTSLEEAVGSP